MACDGNEIDTMFVDRRRDGGQIGQTLVKVLERFVGFCPVWRLEVQQNLCEFCHRSSAVKGMLVSMRWAA